MLLISEFRITHIHKRYDSPVDDIWIMGVPDQSMLIFQQSMEYEHGVATWIERQTIVDQRTYPTKPFNKLTEIEKNEVYIFLFNRKAIQPRSDPQDNNSCLRCMDAYLHLCDVFGEAFSSRGGFHTVRWQLANCDDYVQENDSMPEIPSENKDKLT